MRKTLYIMLMDNKKQLDADVIKRHVEYLKKLDSTEKLYLCGPFSNYKGGIVILSVQSYEEANDICQSDPYVSEGYKTYQLRTLEVAEKENGYLLD